MLELYFNKLKLYNRQGTFKYYKATLKPIISFIYSQKINNFNDIKTNIINDYVNSRLNIVKNSTLNKEIKALETTINFLIKNEYLEKINFKFKKLPTTKTKIESINKEDIQKIINYLKSNCSITSQLIFMLMLTTGIRTNELCHIETHNISIEKKSIQLTFTKNKQPRMIYLLDKIVELIKKIYNTNNKYLFQNPNKECFTQNQIILLFKRIKHKLNIDVLSPHKVRHFYATNIYNKTKNINLVKELLGHQTIEITKIYLDINETEIQKSNELYNPLKDYIY